MPDAASQPEDSASPDPRAVLLADCKQRLAAGHENLLKRHLAGASGIDVASSRADLIDSVLRNLFAATMPEPEAGTPPLALVATGGYGRGLLNPHSDIDILFLYNARKLSPLLESAIGDMLYVLWDTGLKIGHAVRSMREAVSAACADPHILSAAIESRAVAGEAALWKTFHQRFTRQCIRGGEDAYLANRLEDMRLRHEKSLDTVYVQEPQVKNGVGGLRDLHTILWITFVKFGSLDLEALAAHDVLPASSIAELKAAYDFLLRVRTDLHFEEKRARDTLTLFLQGVVATHFNYPQRSILRRCEAFMRDYYKHTRCIARGAAQVLEALEIERVRRTRRRGLVSLFTRVAAAPAREEFDGFVEEEGRLHPASPGIFEEDPGRLLRVFAHAQLRDLTLGPALTDLIHAHLHLIDRSFRYLKSNRLTFEGILRRSGEVARTLRMMHAAGVLGRYLPEFGALDCLVQHEFFHRYTADEHTLRAIEYLDDVATGGDPAAAPFRAMFQEVDNPEILYLALLLHDTGRAENARHHEDASTELAAKVARRLRIEGGQRRLLLFLVDHHLTLWKTATTKNLDDPDVIDSFARVLRQREYLDPLFLLTYADSRATSPNSWNSWKASLMFRLHEHTRIYFADREGFRRRLAMPDADLRENVAKKLPANFDEEIDAHFRLMPERYFKVHRAETIAGHLRIFRSFYENLRRDGEEALLPAFLWESRPEQGCSKLSVVSWNRNLLLARIAACLAARDINILTADIYTREDDLALDVFSVCTTRWEPVTNKSTLRLFERDLKRAFTSSDFRPGEWFERTRVRPGLDTRLPHFPTRVFVSNDVVPASTFVEIQALDRIGLLADVFHVFGALEIEVTSARINTTRGAAIDSFTVTDKMNRQLTHPALLTRLQADLEAQVGLPGSDSPQIAP